MNNEDLRFRLYCIASEIEDEGRLQEAIVLYEMLAEADEVHSMINLANIYDYQLDPPRREDAVRLMKRAHELGDDVAAWNLAMHYRNIGENEEGLRWMRIAAECGLERECAIEILAALGE